jgi:hypothetical protein
MPETVDGTYLGAPLLRFKKELPKGKKVSILFMDESEIEHARQNRERQNLTLSRPDGTELNDASKKRIRRRR